MYKSINAMALLMALLVLTIVQTVPASAKMSNAVYNITGGENVSSIVTSYGNITQITQEPENGTAVWYTVNLTVVMDYKAAQIESFTFAAPDNRTLTNVNNWTIGNGTNSVAAHAFVGGDNNNITFVGLTFFALNTVANVSHLNITFALTPFTIVANEFEYKSGMYNDTWSVENYGTDLNISKANITVLPRNYAQMKTVNVYKTATEITNVTSVGSSMIAITDLNSSYTLRVLYTTQAAESSVSDGSSPSAVRPVSTIDTPLGVLPDSGFLFVSASIVIILACIGSAWIVIKRKR